MSLPGEDDELELEDIELEEEVDEEVEESSDEEAEGGAETSEGDKARAAAESEDEGANVRQPTRGEKRIQTLANARREAETRASKAEAENKALREAQENASRAQQQFQQQQFQQQQYQQEQYRLAQMWETASPEDRVAMLMQKQQQDIARQMAAMQMQQSDAADRAAFSRITATDKVAAKLETEVERRWNAAKSQGFSAAREDIYKHLLGERVMAARAKATTTQGEAGKKRIKQQATPARRGASDRTADRRESSDATARRKRVEGYVF